MINRNESMSQKQCIQQRRNRGERARQTKKVKHIKESRLLN